MPTAIQETRPVGSAKKRKYRLRSGFHVETDWGEPTPEDQQQQKKVVDGKCHHRRTYEPGDIIETERDLAALDPLRFELVTPDQEARQSKQTAKLLGRMTVQQLKEYAEEEEIDLGDATRKEDILAAIRANSTG